MNEALDRPNFAALFFSREAIVAFAPFSTASTRDMVSFQRNPNGGFRYSAARIVDAAKIRRQNVIKTRDMVNRRRRETLSDVVKFSLLGNTLVLFFRQDFFDRERKIKFRFFLVAVQRDF